MAEQGPYTDPRRGTEGTPPEMSLQDAWAAVQPGKVQKVMSEWQHLAETLKAMPDDKQAMCRADCEALMGQRQKHIPSCLRKVVPEWVRADALIRRLFVKARSSIKTQKKPMAGPWEGAMPVGDIPAPQTTSLDGVVMVVWNFRGAFSHSGGIQARDQRIK